MKIYNVIYEYGEYSDMAWSFCGSFSSLEKAEKYVEEKTTPLSDEVVHQKYEEYIANKLASNKDQLNNYNAILAEYKKQQGKGKKVDRRTMDRLREHALCLERLQTKEALEKDWQIESWRRSYCQVPSKDCYKIQDVTLDEPVD